MFLLETVAVVMGKAITCIDLLSLTAVGLIALFLLFIYVRQNKKRRK